MNFSTALDGLDGAVETFLCDDARYLPEGAGAGAPARVQVMVPVEAERLQGIGFTRPRPVLSVSASAIPGLCKGDVFEMGRWIAGVFHRSGEVWRLAEAPSRPGDGRWWQAEVEAL